MSNIPFVCFPSRTLCVGK